MSSFKKKFETIADAIITNAIVMDDTNLKEGQNTSYFYTENAAWDTGAQFSFISPRVVKTLGLKPFGKGCFMGIGGDQMTDIYRVQIGLPNGKIVHPTAVYCCDIDDYDLLIGMDIITETDFLITNINGETTFQFRTPSEDHIVL